ncbi:hypothetical protein VCV18_005876 [Metarhizium anisopliae]
MSSSQTNAWLRAQRKLDLVQVADSVGLKNGVGLWARRVRDSWSSRAPNELDATIGHWTMQHRSIEQETKLPFLKLRDIRQVGTRQFLHLLGVVARGELSICAISSYEGLKKSELEAALDEFIAENSSRLANRSDLAPYFTSRSKALGSPVKREKDSSKDESDKPLKVTKRRVTKALEELTSE